MSITGAPVGQPQKVGVAGNGYFHRHVCSDGDSGRVKNARSDGVRGSISTLGLLDVAVAITANSGDELI